jgi:hypothetical protein
VRNDSILRNDPIFDPIFVMARGDGGKPVFEDDKDRYCRVDLMEKACTRFGWRAHAWVLMGNLLNELPRPAIQGFAHG